MASGMDHSAEEVEQANELYWSSTESVNRIASRLGLSKGSLYAAIKPKPADSMCPTCGSQLGYANRTALERNTLSCSQCTHEFTIRPERSGAAKPREIEAASIVAEAATSRGTRAGPVAKAPVASEAPASGQLVLGTTLLALGTGLLLSRLVRRR